MREELREQDAQVTRTKVRYEQVEGCKTEKELNLSAFRSFKSIAPEHLAPASPMLPFSIHV